MTAVSATSARANLYRLIDQVNDESQPLTITGQRGNAVSIGEADWQAIQETLFLQSVPGFAESILGADRGRRGGVDRTRLVSDWTLLYSRQAEKDAKRLASSGLKQRAKRLLDVLADDPFTAPPRYEKLAGDLPGCYSRRINILHRLVYEVFPDRHVVHVLRMWTRFE